MSIHAVHTTQADVLPAADADGGTKSVVSGLAGLLHCIFEKNESNESCLPFGGATGGTAGDVDAGTAATSAGGAATGMGGAAASSYTASRSAPQQSSVWQQPHVRQQFCAELVGTYLP